MDNTFDYDFSGWATRNDVECSDGRTIKRDAFVGDDGKIVPLVLEFGHQDVTDVLGRAMLCNRPEGVYMYGKFNDTRKGQVAKANVQLGNITALGIYAVGIKHDGMNVIDGSIKEVSLVAFPANPGAVIDYVKGKLIKNTSSEEMLCATCAHNGNSIDEEPCRRCFGLSQWGEKMDKLKHPIDLDHITDDQTIGEYHEEV